jgi:hypothetical protein
MEFVLRKPCSGISAVGAHGWVWTKLSVSSLEVGPNQSTIVVLYLTELENIYARLRVFLRYPQSDCSSSILDMENQ